MTQSTPNVIETWLSARRIAYGQEQWFQRDEGRPIEDAAVLFQVAAMGGVAKNIDLSPALRIDTKGMREAHQRLREKGFIRSVEVSPTDETFFFELTEAGKAEIARLSGKWK